jgi:hypothetical protein
VALNLRVLKRIDSPRGFGIFAIHFTADVDKQADAWEIEARKAFSSESEWQREMEIDFSSQTGKLAYTSFQRGVHVAPHDIEVRNALPLCLEVDFNVDPMVWLVSQVWGGLLLYVDEIYLAPASVEMAVQEFRNRYPAHPAEIWVYGDGTGHGRDAQTSRSDYDLMRLAFRGYPSNIDWRVPTNNPEERDRVNNVNRKLMGAEGKPGILISPKCENLIADFEEVVWRPDGRKLLKIYATADPYHKRTHAGDCCGYHISREWPVRTETARMGGKKPLPPRKYGHLLGSLDPRR